ncbi:MAG: hypothetical protein VW548_06915, partial [Methylotenera sp.]
MINCSAKTSRQNTIQLIRLALESRKLLTYIRDKERINFDSRQSGIMHIYRQTRDFDAACRA